MSHAPDTLIRPNEWQSRGACRLADPDVFFEDTDEAKAVCRRCPVMELCGQWALTTRQEHGVWGGLSEDERRRILRQSTTVAPSPPVAPRRDPAEVFEERTVALDGGHREWASSSPVAVNGRSYTPGRLAWFIEHGALPTGTLKAACGHKGCVTAQHLIDLGPPATGCGTRNGYNAHRARGEDACRPCKNANADGDRRLRNTGTSKQLTA